MSVAIYIWRKTIKNWLIQLKQKPVQLVLFSLLILFFLSSVVSLMFLPSSEAVELPDKFTYLTPTVFFLVTVLIFLFAALSNSSKGLFIKADAQFLFTAPMDNKKVLIIGTVKKIMKMAYITLLIAIYPIFFNSFLQFELIDLFAFYVCIGLVAIIAVMIALITFIYTINSKKQKKLIEKIIFAPFVIGLIYFIVNFDRSIGGVDNIYNFMNNKVVANFPLVGWQFSAYQNIASGDIGLAVAYIIGSLAIFAVLVYIFSKIRNEYYEEAINDAEAYSKQREAKNSGDITKQIFGDRKTKVKGTGINGGSGASVLFYKHRLEMKRSGTPFIDGSGIFNIALNVIFLLFFKAVGMPPEALLFVALMMSCYISIFFAFSSAWEREIKGQFIYTLPDSPFKKLLWAILSTVIKSGIEAVILFTVLGILARASILDVFMCILVYISFQLCAIAGNVVFYRVFKTVVSNKSPLKALMFLFITLIALPGTLLGIIFAVTNSNVLFLSLTVFINLLLALLVIYISKNVLEKIDQ